MIGVAVLGAALLVPAAAQAHPGPHDGMRNCGTSNYFRSNIRANAATSCPFGRGLDLRARAYDRRHTLRFGERFSMRVYSFVTWRSYRMRCRVRSAPPRIDCYGGNGAHVQIVQAG
jgi:hypothetical protein